MMNSKILFIIFFIISYVKCFKTGVTRQSCTSMRPEHKRPNTDWEYAPQFTRDPPFEIRVNTTKVKPGDLVEGKQWYTYFTLIIDIMFRSLGLLAPSLTDF